MFPIQRYDGPALAFREIENFCVRNSSTCIAGLLELSALSRANLDVVRAVTIVAAA